MKATTQSEQQAKTNGESGFMLVFAAVMIALVLIALAVAVPVISKQLRRDKEEESVHRMQQYVRAIQLYQRACKCTNYPPSMDALEKGTNVRFLRQRYVDPLTGKSDWRIIHNPQTTVKGFFGQELAGLVAGLGSAANMSSGTSTATVGAPISATAAPGATGATGSTGSCNTINAGGLASGFNGAQTCNNGSTGSTGSSDAGMFGDSSSGGPIKGVGSSRTGESILTPNDQDTYETWEFWYDPRIELLKSKVNILGGGGPATGSTTSSLGSTDAGSFGNNLNGTPNKSNNGSGSSTPTTTPTPQ